MDYFERVKCKMCKENYGAENNGWVCNSCYKKKNDDALKNLTNTIEEKKEEIKIEDDKPKQTNIYNCWKCDKKVGHLGFKCDCGFIYCKSHRHFSDHECDFNFKDKTKIK